MNTLLKLVVVLLVAASFASAAQATPRRAPNDSTCSLCTFMVSTVESYLANNQTVLQIEAMLNKVCYILPDVLQAECIMMVAQLPEIVKQLQDQYPPEVVCTNIGLCNKTAVVPKDSTSCPLCEFAVDQIEQYLLQNATQQQIIESLEYICQLVPQQFQSSCIDLISQVPICIKYLKEQFPPKEICTRLGFCESMTYIKHSMRLANIVRK
jgi:saposin